jgi:hypothetical protein
LAELGSELQGLEEFEGESSRLQGMDIEPQGLGELEGESSQDKKTQKLKLTNCRVWKNLKENCLGTKTLDSDEVMQGMNGGDCFRAWVVNCRACENWKENRLETRRHRNMKMTHNGSPLSQDKNLGWQSCNC